MYATSTQRRFWHFSSAAALTELRAAANMECRVALAKNLPPHIDADNEEYFLSAAEEHTLLEHYACVLANFCAKFVPKMPSAVLSCAQNYYKRVYLRHSAMDYHPKDLLVTIVFLACKIEEFNVSLDQFLENVQGDRQKARDVILGSELLVLQLLNHQLQVHHPYRPVEGFIIDIKARAHVALNDEPALRACIASYLEKCLYTDACLLYTPSQLALSAVLHGVKSLKLCIDDYVLEQLCKADEKENVAALIQTIKQLRLLVHDYKLPAPDAARAIEQKLRRCRNPLHDPNSELYRDRLRRLYGTANHDNVEPSTADGSFQLLDSSIEHDAAS